MNLKQINNTAIYCLLVLVTIIAYFPLYKNGFIGFDDHTYIYQNRVLQNGFSWESLRFAFSFDNKTSYWHPLTWLSLMLDYQLWGLNPAGYHLENLLIHTMNGLLLFTLLRSATDKTAASTATALFFLLHPAAVESVAWAVERKTVLSTFFFLAAIAAYLRYTKAPSMVRYLAVFIFMAMGLMTKSMIITLPFLLLLLDIWPLGRWNIRSDGGAASVIALPLIVEKIPLMALSAGSVIISLVSHSASNIIDTTPLGGRISHAVVAYAQHLGKIFWSSDHSVFYPLPPGHQLATILLSAGLLTAITIVSIRYLSRYPWIAFGWFWYLIAFAPVSGLLRAGKWPGMADRFLYIPAMGIVIAVCFTAADIVDKKPAVKPLFVILLFFFATLFGYQSNLQTRKWRDSITLFSDAIRIDPNNSYAYYLLGRSLALEKKEYAAAENHLKSAISRNPTEAYYKADLGGVYLSKGEPERALPYLREASLVIMADADVVSNLGSALLETGKNSEALIELERAFRINPMHVNARFNSGVALYKLGRFTEAQVTFETLLRTDPGHNDARINLGMTLIELKKYDLAIEETQRALSRSPNDTNALTNLGTAYEKMGKYDEAVTAYKKAISLQPDLKEAREGIARLPSF